MLEATGVFTLHLEGDWLPRRHVATGDAADDFESTLADRSNGHSWTISTTANPGTSREINAVSTEASGPVFAVGTLRTASGNSHTLILRR
jgi:hypothetical protein